MRQPTWLEVTWFFIHAALTDDAMAHGTGEYFILRRSRWFYRFKAIVCLILSREPDYTKDRYQYLDSVTVAVTAGGHYSSPDGEIYWGEYLNVGYGVFRNWWHCIYQGSN